MEKIFSIIESILMVMAIGAIVLIGPKLVGGYNANTERYIQEFQQEHYIPGSYTVERDITGLTMRYENLVGGTDEQFVSTLDLLMWQ